MVGRSVGLLKRQKISFYRFVDSINIIFTVQKKMSTLNTWMDNFKEHLKIKSYIMTKQRTEKKFSITIYCKEEHIHVK